MDQPCPGFGRYGKEQLTSFVLTSGLHAGSAYEKAADAIVGLVVVGFHRDGSSSTFVADRDGGVGISHTAYSFSTHAQLGASVCTSISGVDGSQIRGLLLSDGQVTQTSDLSDRALDGLELVESLIELCWTA